MQLLDGRLVHSASDLNAYTECLHLTALTRLVAEGELTRPDRDDPTADLLAAKGDEHERRHLERLRATYGDRLVEFEGRPPNSVTGYEAAERASVAAMASGAEVIYQPTFFDGTFLGRADFLRRVSGTSRFGNWRYMVLDTKLALSVKPYFLIQLCGYAEHLDRIQGPDPQDKAAIVLGTGEEPPFRIAEYAAYYRRLKAAYLASVARGDDAYPLACEHCDLCAWRDACEARRDRDDHLGLVAGIRRDQMTKLAGGGIATLGALAAATDGARPSRLRDATFATLREQAVEQHRHRAARDARGFARHSYRFREGGVPTDPDLLAAYGFARLPEPGHGDVFFDMEGDPMYRPGRSLEYLFGVYLPLEDRYESFWGCDQAAERDAFERFIDFVVARRAEYPGMHVYHYAPYELTALRRLAMELGSREREIDQFLREGVLVDLYPVVKQSVVVSQPSYSIKKLEALTGFERTRGVATRAGDDSIVMFERWLQTQDDALLEDIRAYNDDDCRSTYVLREWLVRLREERNARLAAPIAWRAPIVDTRKRKPDVAGGDAAALATGLLAGIIAPRSLAELRTMPPAQRERWLVANLITFHERDTKPAWWKHYHRLSNVVELAEDDHEAIGGLTYDETVTPYRPADKSKSDAHGYRFPPQEHTLGVGDAVLDQLGNGSGKIVAIDDGTSTVHVQIPREKDARALRALLPGSPYVPEKAPAAIRYIADAFIAGRLATDHPATAALLSRALPRFTDRAPGEDVQPAELTETSLSSRIAALDASYLVVQGPPGSGKSTMGAAVVLDLLAAGKRVALAAQSHKALHGLLRKIESTARLRGVTYRGCHRRPASDVGKTYLNPDGASWIASVTTAAECEPFQLVSGACFSWPDASQRGRFDVVVFDESGQISLADALAVSLVARNVVLLGDPQQLPQVSQGTHPIGVARSVLEHLIDEDETVRRDRGIFLDVTYRMHPEIDRFVSESFYAGRLASAPQTRGNRIVATGALHGSGLRWMPIQHEGHARRSRAEATAIADAVADLLAHGRVSVSDEPERPLHADDVLVVAPYNAQRLAIDDALRARGIAGVEVGTVDKFQGQQAPVVFFSLATSSAELAPRGLEFLLSPNRFNVAISRAKALAVVVGSPRLAESRATTIETMRLTNLLCRYIEAAQLVSAVHSEAPTAV